MTSSRASDLLIGVDLASRFSAVVVRDARGEVVSQFDSSEMAPFEFVTLVGAWARNGLTLIEDLPYGISGQAQTKSVTRLQGFIIHEVFDKGGSRSLDDVLFVSPSTWMKHYGGFRLPRKGPSKAERERMRLMEMRETAEKFGYYPPGLAADYVVECRENDIKPKAVTVNALLKSETDYVAAFLITEWARQLGESVIRAESGVQPVLI